MGRFLGALLLVVVAGCSTPPLTVANTEPMDWFRVNPDPVGTSPTYPAQVGYRQSPADVVVKFRNGGTETVEKPTIRFEIKPRSDDGERYTAVVNGDGDGWTCEIEDESATCRSSEQVPPGEDLPQIDIGVKFVPPAAGWGYISNSFTITFANVVFEGTISYNSSV